MYLTQMKDLFGRNIYHVLLFLYDHFTKQWKFGLDYFRHSGKSLHSAFIWFSIIWTYDDSSGPIYNYYALYMYLHRKQIAH
jgi:hypothetical protein